MSDLKLLFLEMLRAYAIARTGMKLEYRERLVAQKHVRIRIQRSGSGARITTPHNHRALLLFKLKLLIVKIRE